MRVYLKGFVNMIPNEYPPVVLLSVYVEGFEGVIQSLDEGAITHGETLLDCSFQSLDRTFLRIHVAA